MSSLCTQFHIHAGSKDTRTRIMTSVGSVCNGCYSRTAKNERVVLGTRAGQMSVFCMSCWDTAEFTCSICAASPAASDVVGCDTCGQWFHKDCTLATAASNAQFENSSGHWECHDCKAESCAHVPSLGVQKEYQSMFQAKVKTMSDKYHKRMSNLESKYLKQVQQVSAEKNALDQQQNQLVVDAIHSQHESEMASLKSRHDDLLKMAIQSCETKLSTLRGHHALEKVAHQGKLQQEVLRERARSAAVHAERAKKVIAEHERTVAALKEKFRAKLERIKDKVVAKMNQEKASACQEMGRLGQLANKRKRDRDKMVEEVTRLANTVNHMAKRMRGQ